MLFTTLSIVWSKKTSIIVKYWKKLLSKEFLITKKDNKDFKNSTKCWICDNTYVGGHVKIRDYCHIIGKYRGSAHRDSNINVKINHKITIVFYSNCIILQFLSFLLQCLAKNLSKNDFKYLSQEFENNIYDLVK